jgi:arylformamidase
MTNILAEEANWPRETLDRDYSARATVSVNVFDAEMRRYRDLSDAVRDDHATHLDVVYDDKSGQMLDIFGTADEARPVFVFIHGGYWRTLSKRDSAFMVATLAKHGIATVAIDYRLAPAASLAEIVREVRAAIGFLWRNGRQYGIDPDRIHVGGSSAGGHLAGALIAGGWQEKFGVPQDVIKGALPVSGLFHLAPIAKSFVQDWIALDDAAVAALSPAEHLPSLGCPIVLAYADSEAAGFKRQSKEYHRLWLDAGFPSTLIEIEGRNHFDVIVDLASEDTVLTRALLDLINGKR